MNKKFSYWFGFQRLDRRHLSTSRSWCLSSAPSAGRPWTRVRIRTRAPKSAQIYALFPNYPRLSPDF